MIYSSVGYCRCSTEIWIEYIAGREGWRTRFTDSQGREVVRCPQCGRELREDDLASLQE